MLVLDSVYLTKNISYEQKQTQYINKKKLVNK